MNTRNAAIPETIAVTQERPRRDAIVATWVRASSALALAALLVIPGAIRADDVLYPEYKKNPLPPTVVVEEIVVDDEPVVPGCNPANEDCDDPEPASGAVVLAQ